LVREYERILAVNSPQSVDQFASRLHAGKSASDDDEVPKPPAELWIGLELDLRNPAQHHVADMHCVADGLQGQRMLLETGDEVEPRAVSECEHQMLVGKR